MNLPSCWRKFNHICVDLDSGLSIQIQDVQDILSSLNFWDLFSPISPKDGDRIVGEVRPSCMASNLAQSWLTKDSRSELLDWLKPITNALLLSGEVVIQPVLQDQPSISGQGIHVSGCVVASQLQWFLENTDYLDPFQAWLQVRLCNTNCLGDPGGWPEERCAVPF